MRERHPAARALWARVAIFAGGENYLISTVAPASVS